MTDLTQKRLVAVERMLLEWASAEKRYPILPKRLTAGEREILEDAAVACSMALRSTAQPSEKQQGGDLAIATSERPDRASSDRVELLLALDALRHVLPMAKGYAAAHDVGNNELIVMYAEAVLAKATDSSGGHDAPTASSANNPNAVVSEHEGWVSVPVAKLRRYELMFEVGATTGIDAYSVDGTKTANAQICRECSDELGAMIAAISERDNAPPLDRAEEKERE